MADADSLCSSGGLSLAISDDLVAVSVAGSLSSLAVAGTCGKAVFTCAKCAKVFPLASAVMRGKQRWCRSDLNSYVGLCDRIKKDSKLKAWWQALGDDGQRDWFIKQQTLVPGQKRLLLMVNCAKLNAAS